MMDTQELEGKLGTTSCLRGTWAWDSDMQACAASAFTR